MNMSLQCVVVLSLLQVLPFQFCVCSTYPVSGDQLGPVLDSIGAQSTAGTARLLYDYPDDSREEILDLLFKPNYGASLQHLKVEIGGDAQISCGAEASPMRTANLSDANFNRGYEHWLMSEAKKRNPSIVLLGLVYAFPNWINPTGNTPYTSNETEARAATYVADWVGGVKSAHNITIDWVGLWNEREYTKSYVFQFRNTLDQHGLHHVQIVGPDRSFEPMATDYLQDPKIRSAIAAISAHYPHCNSHGDVGTCTADIANALKAREDYNVPLWSSEDYSCWTDAMGAGVWASLVNSNYIGGNMTMSSAWHLVSAFYPTVTFWNEGLMSAMEPWSGHYVRAPTLWVTAHTTQFTTPGSFYYLRQGGGSGALVGGGSYVSLVNKIGDITIVIETAGSAIGPFSAGNCNGHTLYEPALASQNATFQLMNMHRPITSLVLWRTRLGTNASSLPSAETHLFEQLPPVDIYDGSVTIVVEADAVYTLSTVTTARKGGKTIPTSTTFPLPYADNFESTSIARPGKYFSDMEGAFEIAQERGSLSNNSVLVQTTLTPACCNFISALDGPLPLSIIGSSSLEDVAAEVSIRVSTTTSTSFGVLGVRTQYGAGTFFQGGLALPTGLFLAIDSKAWMLVDSVAALGSGNGLPWPCSISKGCLCNGSVTQSAWHRVGVAANNRSVTVHIDGVVAPTISLREGIATGGGFVSIVSDRSAVMFDNFSVSQFDGSTRVSRCDVKPAVGQTLVGVGCGEAAASNGSRWQIGGGDGGVGRISLRSDPTLCLGTVKTPTPPLSPLSSSPTWQDNGVWTTQHGAEIAISTDQGIATWGSGVDAVGLIDSKTDAGETGSHWILSRGGTFADVGWCLPDIDKTGKVWMGWQAGKAWVYRGWNGLFKVANGTRDQGEPYGPAFGADSNVTALRHSSVSVEFLLNGVSLGAITIPSENAIPATAVPCAGGGAGTILSLEPASPPTKLTEVELQHCDVTDTNQLWQYSTSGLILHKATNTALGINAGAAGNFPDVGVGGGSTALWWSPDLTTGFIHGKSNSPMNCPCVTVCG